MKDTEPKSEVAEGASTSAEDTDNDVSGETVEKIRSCYSVDHATGVSTILRLCRVTSRLTQGDNESTSLRGTEDTPVMVTIEVQTGEPMDQKHYGVPRGLCAVLTIWIRRGQLKGCVIDHYLREELDDKTMPFQCKLCPARFYRKHPARIHKNRDHCMHTEPFRRAFWGSLRDLRTTDMVRRPAFLRGNRPWRTAKVPAQATPSRNEDPNAEPRVPARARLGRKRSAPLHPQEAKGSADYDLVSDGESNVYPDNYT